MHSRFIEKSMYSIYIIYCLLRRVQTSKSGKWSTMIAHSKWTQLFCNFNMFETFFKATNEKKIVHSFQQCTKDRKEWRALVRICNWMSFALHCVLSDRSPMHWWLSPGEGRDAITWCGWDKLYKGHNYWKSRPRSQVYVLRGVSWWLCVCVLSDFTWLPLLDGGRKSWYAVYLLNVYYYYKMIAIFTDLMFILLK